MTITVTELTDVPPLEPNCSSARFLYWAHHGDHRTALVYEVNPHTRPGVGWTCIEFEGVWKVCGGWPNDEALHNHPMARYGDLWCSPCEILNSPWLVTELTAAHKDRRPPSAELLKRKHHYVFSFKEDLFECIADGYTVHGPFPSYQSAWQHAGALVSAPLE